MITDVAFPVGKNREERSDNYSALWQEPAEMWD